MPPLVIAAAILAVLGLVTDTWHRQVHISRDMAPAALRLHNTGLALTAAGGFLLGLAIPGQPWWAAILAAYTVGSFLHGLDLRTRVRTLRRTEATAAAARAAAQTFLDATAAVNHSIKAVYDQIGPPPPRRGDTVSFVLADSELAQYLNPKMLDKVLTGEIHHVYSDQPEVQVKVPGWATTHTVPIARLLYPRTDHQ